MSENWQEFTEETVNALLEDGSDPDAEYTVEHIFIMQICSAGKAGGGSI